MHRISWLTVTLLALGPIACDDPNSVPPDVLSKAMKQQVPETRPAPTTQELVSGPHKTLKLGNFPLTLEVPRAWELKSDGGLISVAGAASSGDISIQLVQQAGGPGKTISLSSLDQLLPKFKAEADAKPHPVNRVQLRELPGGAKVLEQRMISNEFVAGKLPPEQWGNTDIVNERTGEKLTTRAIVNPHLLKWNLTVFLPVTKDQFEARGLTFMGLKLSEYEQDKQFLEKLVESLQYEAN